jgi:hypothetical protein
MACASEPGRNSPPTVTRAALWLPLLQRLTESVSSWGVWKRSESALEGDGDVDALGSETEWGLVVDEFRAWAQQRALGPVVACTHFPDLLVLAACEGERPTRLLQMDVSSYQVFRGARFASASDLRPLMRTDARGFRRLRPGAEGLLLLLAEGVRRGGRPVDAPTAKGIARLLRQDPEGVEETASVIGAPGRHALAGARALAGGGWDRRALVLLELSSAFRLLRDPRELTACFARDARGFRKCGLVRALEAGRRVPGDRNRWLDEMRRSHSVYEAGQQR